MGLLDVPGTFQLGMRVTMLRILRVQLLRAVGMSMRLMSMGMLMVVRVRMAVSMLVGMHQVAVAMLVNVEMLVRMFMMMLVSMTVRLAGSVAVFVSAHGSILS